MNVTLRKAKKKDLKEVLGLIKELALYEKAPQEVTISLAELEEDGFGNRPLFEIILAEANSQIIGIAFYFLSYSTWKGKCIYLEDLIVKEEMRGKGIGSLLFEEMITIAKVHGAKRLSWQVLDWNESAIRFYEKYGANLDPEWLNGRLTREQLLHINTKNEGI
jgi:GNAT superfamily N-acetyltransferase